jgi:hypothetical protein
MLTLTSAVKNVKNAGLRNATKESLFDILTWLYRIGDKGKKQIHQ